MCSTKNIYQRSAQSVLHQLQQRAKSFTKLSYSAIDNVVTNLLPAGLHDFFQVLNISNATKVNSLLGLSLSLF